MALIISFICIVVISFVYSIFQMRSMPSSFDHYGHLGRINAIRSNKHRFFLKHPLFLGLEFDSYPHFYHWLLSFIPEASLNKHYKYINAIINSLQLICFSIFIILLKPYLTINNEIFFAFSAGLIFLLTPMNFAYWNAKNSGLSARGLGVLFVHLFLYISVLHGLTNNIYLFIGLYIIGFLIIISSQFSFQFILLSAPILAILFKTWLFVLTPFVSFFIFYIVMPKVAINYIKGQFNHKRMYLKYFTTRNILNKRPSIWRDFVFDFWKNFKVLGVKKSIIYIYKNPLVIILLGIPAIIVLICYMLFIDIPNDEVFKLLIIPVITGILIFIITSFRWTRFLGEPERYMDFVIPFISIIYVWLFQDYQIIVYFLLTYSILHLLLIRYLLKNVAVKSKIFNLTEIGTKLNKFITENVDNKEEIRIFSNNVFLIKYFMGMNYKLIMSPAFTEYLGGFHVTQLFPVAYGSFSEKTIIPLIKKFKINWFILDKDLLPDFNKLITNESITFKKINTIENLVLYKVCSRI